MGKPADSCYTFWNLGALRLIGDDMAGVEREGLRDFLLMCQSPKGGLMKFPWADEADPVHTCHGIMGAALAGLFGLSLDPAYDLKTGCFRV